MQFEGELYILATDQGYINQPDLVWEKLNEVRAENVGNKYLSLSDLIPDFGHNLENVNV